MFWRAKVPSSSRDSRSSKEEGTTVLRKARNHSPSDTTSHVRRPES